MVRSLWTPGMTNVLLRHVESLKGEESLYLKDYNLALEEAKARLASSHPQQPVSTTQIRSRLEHLWYRKKKSPSSYRSFLLKGRSLLGTDCAEEALNQAQRKQDSTFSAVPRQPPAGLCTGSKSKVSRRGKRHCRASGASKIEASPQGERRTRRGSSLTSLPRSHVSESRSPPSILNEEVLPR